MAETQREIERKFEFTHGDGTEGGGAGPGRGGRLPDLTGTAGITEVRAEGTVRLDAVYYDTPDRRLAAAGLTLRRRTGGHDAGWHLKLPVAPGVRDEIRAPLADTPPRALTALVRSRVRGSGLEPQVRLGSERVVSHLLDARGDFLAELSTDTVRAERGTAVATWTEVEVELGDGVDPALLDAVEKRFRKAGLRVSDAPSKLARALAETGAAPAPAAAAAEEPPEGTAGAHLLAYLREQRDALIALDPAVRLDLPDSVHQMRVATRRLRSALATHRRIIDRATTDPLREELRHLAAELGADRDREVLLERLRTRLGELPRTLLHGPVRSRLRTWNAARRSATRRRAVAVLDSPRHLALLDALDALLADPPLRAPASRPAGRVLPKAVLRDWDRLAHRVGAALDLEPGEERDLALHEARKAAKRARYAAEAAAPALGKPARRLARAAKNVQTLLGEHRDGVVTREALHRLALQAAGAGESSFTWGVLYGREEEVTARCERELPAVWAEADDPALRAALT
ncbi:CHAD domain-containing protein [Streptomyces lavendulae]|uniref:CYTH and CHAD domain-containing protein n=1 Tax=Streptomyces lavendulae TaxID=1914 RepID=UPI0036DFC598